VEPPQLESPESRDDTTEQEEKEELETLHKIPEVGEFVLVYDRDAPFGCYPGEVMDVGGEENGAVQVWGYGDWTTKTKQFWEYKYRRGYIDNRSELVLFHTPKHATHYRKYLQWVEMENVICTFQPHRGRGTVLVPEKEGEEAMMWVRDRRRFGDDGEDNDSDRDER
jgi:hypothetical protein